MAGEPLVVTAMRQYKADLLGREARQMREMSRRWLQVEQALEPQIMALTQEMAEQRAMGLSLTDAKVRQLKRYKALLLQAQDEIRGYTKYAASEVRAGQEILARLGVEQATQLIDMSFQPGVGVSFRRLPVDEVQYMVGMAGDGRPLGELLKQRMILDENGVPLPGVWDKLTTNLVEGTALGWNPEKTARLMRDGLAGGLQKALVIARTEQLRVYRESTRATYEESGIVKGHKRVCAHDMRVCPACLADDGQVYPVTVAIPDHPQGRCVGVPCLEGMKAPTWTAGEDWLKLQNEDVQKSILGGHYDGWKVGDFGLGDTLRRTEHKVWGPGLAVKSLRELGGTRRATPPANAGNAANVGTPVSQGLQMPGGADGKEIAAAVDIIDQVHGDGKLPQIPVTVKNIGGPAGQFTFDSFGTPIGIDISPNMPYQRITMAHEVGHFLDRGAMRAEMTDDDIWDKYTAWWDRVKDSKALKRLEELRTKGEVRVSWTDHKGKRRRSNFKVNQRYVEYLESEVECWARSYSQYVAVRGSDPVMAQELASLREHKNGQLYYPMQWDDKDFEPIAGAIDTLFRALGWVI